MVKIGSFCFLFFTLFACSKQSQNTIAPQPLSMNTDTVHYLALGDSYTIGTSIDFFDNYPNQTFNLLLGAGFKITAPQIIAKNGWTSIDLENAIKEVNAKKNTYQLVTICNQTWMKSNLNVSHYRNGDVIPQVTDATQWGNLTTGAWCYYNNDSANGAVYGKLYNWYAVNDPRGLAPQGCHIPTDNEWNSLIGCLDSSYNSSAIGVQSTIAGGSLKETGTLHWINPNTGATNTSGFTALGGNYRFGGGGGSGGAWGPNPVTISPLGITDGFWSSTENDITNAWHRYIGYNNASVKRGNNDKSNGFYVRCLKD